MTNNEENCINNQELNQKIVDNLTNEINRIEKQNMLVKDLTELQIVQRIVSLIEESVKDI